MRADALERRRRILANARHMFATHGHGVALELIAEASHVGVGTFYRNFSSREDLTRAVIVELIADIGATVDTFKNHEVNATTWSEFLHALAGLGLGAFVDVQDVKTDADVMTAQEAALDKLKNLLSTFVDARVVRSDISVFDLIVALGILTRPQPEPISAVAPHVSNQLLHAFIDYTLKEEIEELDCDASYSLGDHGEDRH